MTSCIFLPAYVLRCLASCQRIPFKSSETRWGLLSHLFCGSVSDERTALGVRDTSCQRVDTLLCTPLIHSMKLNPTPVGEKKGVFASQLLDVVPNHVEIALIVFTHCLL